MLDHLEFANVNAQYLSMCAPSAVEASASLEALGWQAQLRQLKSGAEGVDMSAVAGSSVALMRVQFDAAVHQIAVPPKGFTTFGLPVGPQAPGRMGRRTLESETLTCFHPDDGFDAVSQPDFAAYTLAIASPHLEHTSALFDHPNAARIEQMGGVQLAPASAQLIQLRSMLNTALIFMSDSKTSEKARDAMWQEFESEVSIALLKAWQGSEHIAYVPPSSRSRALKKALEYIHSAGSHTVTIDQLCREACCSLSTLERAFREHFGITPKRYLTAARLCDVRHHLLETQGTKTIADVASDFGFWHMSKFAADYRQLFAELPSQTCRH